MALVLVSGLACSGRTTRSKELIADFEQRNKESQNPMRIIRLSNKDVNVRKSQFATQKQEKPARAAYLSLVMRNLSKNTLVIADGGAGTNIKGFRYQLWCAARETGVRCVSVFCVSSKEACKRRNDKRQSTTEDYDDEEKYEDHTLEELLMRFEEPNAMTRWDSPLFVVDCNAVSAEGDWEKAPLDAIWDAATKGKVTKAPDVVAPIRGTTGNYLSLLESTTQLVLSSFQELASFGSLPDAGGEVQLSLAIPDNPTTVQLALHLPLGQKTPTTAALQRLRRQFVKMHASGATAGNELGYVLSQEGRVSAFASQADSRAERKAQQSLQKNLKETKPKSIEEEIAKRFIAYLEETL